MRAILFILIFLSLPASAETITLPQDFTFGVANAPGQVEDQLNDIWLDWGNQGKIHAWKAADHPADRLQFWTKPEVELDLAQNLGVGAFRMGIDWGRVMPSAGTFDAAAIARYREIIQMVKARNMKVMMTLSHHSVPKWVQESGGWHSDENKKMFVLFAERMITEFNGDIDWWLTFNEANIFAFMAYTTGAWPPGEQHGIVAMWPIPFVGSSLAALDKMADAHNEIYEWAHKKFPQIKIGIAHNMAHYRGKGFIDQLQAGVANYLMNWRLPNRLRDHMDFFGLNYYGAEWFNGTAITNVENEEYSEAGRSIDVNGLLDLLKEVHTKFSELPILITENGIADAEDGIRSSYIIEHLTAIHEAIAEGIPVKGYFLWTLTDNLEWADGYCPKFGLVAVDRQTFSRNPRPSYSVYKQIASTKQITDLQRDETWKNVLRLQGTLRPYCRAQDGSTGLDSPEPRNYSHKDWRFKK